MLVLHIEEKEQKREDMFPLQARCQQNGAQSAPD